MPELGLLPELGPNIYLYPDSFEEDDEVLDITRAADELQSWQAQQSKGKHQKRQSKLSRCPNSVCHQSW
eukprot:4228282-Pyramimonas_sp.AAC.1